MKRQKRVLALVGAAGLAASGTASAQLEFVSNLPGNWVDITSTGTYYNLGDDGVVDITSTAGNTVLPAAASHRITNNGAISWGSQGGTAFTNQSIPSTALAGGGQGLAVYWDDLYTYPAAMTPAEGVYVQTISGTLIVTWRVGHITATNSTGEVQLQVFSSGPVIAQYLYRQVDGYGGAQNNGGSATIGYQNGTGGFNDVEYAFNRPNSVTNGTILSLVFSGPTGACCLPSGACSISTNNACASAGGIYRGDGTTCPANCPQPPTGACCLPDLTCVITWQGGCTAQGGTYRGNNTVCSQCPQAWQEQGDAGDLPATAQFVTGSGSLPGITGRNDTNDTDLYAIQITDSANFRATTVGTGTNFDTMLWLFDASGHGVVGNDDDQGLLSTLTSQYVPGNGLYYLALTRFFRIPVDAGQQNIWDFFSPEQQPNGPGAANEVAGWLGDSGDGGVYLIALQGTSYINPATIGACCLPSGACALNTSAGCSSAGGIYRGNGTTCPANCPQPPTGACCLPNLTCVVVWQGGCTAQGGTYRGDNTPCTQCPQAWQEQGDAGDLPGSAQAINGSGNLPGIVGNLDFDDADMYRLQICDSGNFSATLVDPNIFWDTQLFLFDVTGHGVSFDDDSQGTLQSTLTAQFVPGNGEYFLAVSGFDHDPVGDTTASEIWEDQPYPDERRPDGPGAGEAVGSWNGGGDGGEYTIRLTGACYIGAACYADCNHDHQLNVNDFVCFQSAFAGGSPQADCNHDSLLNVNDFVCFQSSFAAGCSSL